MFTVFTLLALAASSVQALTVASPASMVQCQPTKLSWAQGSAPFFVSIIPGGQAGAAPLKDFGKQDGNELTYTVDLPAGAITIKVVDSTGETQYSSIINITPGSDTSCLNGGGAAGGAAPAPSSAAAGGAAPSSDAAAPAPTSAAAPTSAGGAAGSAGAASSGSAKPASSSGAAASGAAKPSGSASPSPAASAPGSAAGLTAKAGVVVAAGLLALAAF